MNRHEQELQIELAAKIKATVERECRKRGGVPADVMTEALMHAAIDLLEARDDNEVPFHIADVLAGVCNERAEE